MVLGDIAALTDVQGGETYPTIIDGEYGGNGANESSTTDGLSNPTLLYGPDDNILNGNPFFMKFVDWTSFQTMIDLGNYLRPVYEIQINAEAVSTVTNLLTPDAIKNNERLVISRGAFEGSPVKDDVYLTLSGSVQTANTQDNLKFLQGVVEEIDRGLDEVFAIDMSDGRIKDIITTNHKKMKTYMDNVIFNYSYHYFRNAQEKMRKQNEVMFSTQDPNVESNKMPKRAALVASTYISKRLYNDLVSFLQEVFDEFLSKQKLNTDVISDCIKSLGNKESFNSTFYYHVRTKMVEKVAKASKGACGDIFKSFKAMEGNEIASYVNKILVDLFLKTSGPLIQYVYVASLLKRYMHIGDFINSRLGLFTQITYISYISNTMSSVITNWKSVTSTSSPVYDSLSVMQTNIDDITYKINLYLQNMNRIDLTSTNSSSEDELKKIVADLQKFSTSVSGQALDISDYKKTIQESRLAMRNILYNTETIKNKRKNKLIEFYIILSLLILVSLVCIILLILQKELYVFYVAGATVMGILLYQLILMIIYFVKKN